VIAGASVFLHSPFFSIIYVDKPETSALPALLHTHTHTKHIQSFSVSLPSGGRPSNLGQAPAVAPSQSREEGGIGLSCRYASASDPDILLPVLRYCTTSLRYCTTRYLENRTQGGERDASSKNPRGWVSCG